MNGVYINIRVPEELKGRAEKAAKKAGVGFSEFVRDALHLYTHFSHPSFMKTVQQIAALYGMGNSLVIQNIVLRYAAENLAAERVFGIEEELPSVPEFQRTRTGIKTDDELLKDLVDVFTEKFEVEKRCAGTLEKERIKLASEKAQEGQKRKK